MQCLALQNVAQEPGARASLGSVLAMRMLSPCPRHPEAQSVPGAGYSQVRYVVRGSGRRFIAQVQTGRTKLAIKYIPLLKFK